jgi:TMEM175 potassium channel family protein
MEAKTGDRGVEGLDFGRIVAFSDGVFAIAATLLVLEITVPHIAHPDAHKLWHEVGDLHPQLISYAIGFIVIGRMWIVHHRLFGALTHFNERLILLNLLFLALIALVPFPSAFLGDYPGESPAVIVYAIVITAMSVVSIWMWRYALHANLLKPEWRDSTRGHVRLLWIAPAILLLSIPLALVSTTLAICWWALILVVHPANVERMRRVGRRPAKS